MVECAKRGCSSVVERLLPKQDIVSSSLITRSNLQIRTKHRHFNMTVFCFHELLLYQFYFLDSSLKSFDVFTGSFMEYFFIRRFNMSVFSRFESLLVDNFVTRRFNTFIISGFESLLEENFLIRRFNMSIFSGFERLFFAVITHQPLQCAYRQ